MAQFYFDIETTGFDCEKDKIISIQYQQLDWDGKSKDELVILKEWQRGEESIIKHIHLKMLNMDNWFFIPIGTNLIFDLTFLWAKFKKYGLKCPDLSKFLYDKPLIDIKYSLVMANSLSFKGAGLDQMTNKKGDGRNIPIWYKNKEYIKIEDYIKQETDSFIEFFQKMILKLKELKK